MTRALLVLCLVSLSLRQEPLTWQQRLDLGGLVTLPAGDIVLTEPLRVWKPVRLVGAGPGLTRVVPSLTAWQPVKAVGLIEITGSDVTVESLTVDGLNDQRPLGRTHGIWVKGGANRVRIAHVQSVNHPGSTPLGGVGGDGLVISVDAEGNHPYHITVEDFYAAGNVRQGISITAGRWMHFSNIRTRSTSGTDPGAGIDIEPDHGSHVVTDVVIDGWFAEGNQYGLLVVNPYSAFIERVLVRNAVLRKNRLRDVQVGDAGVDYAGVVSR